MSSSRPLEGAGSSVFVNCPFDDEYLLLLRPLLFTVLFLGFRPRIASERSDSAETRIDKICELVSQSRYSIHDLSRIQAAAVGEFYRLNMAFELGVDYGARRFGDEALRSKRCLILEKNRYDYPRALSDLAGVDIKAHRDEPEEIARAVRDWFVETVGLRGVPSATQIWYRFTEFTSDFYDERRREGFSDQDLNMMPVPEYMNFIGEWLLGPR